MCFMNTFEEKKKEILDIFIAFKKQFHDHDCEDT